MRVVTYSDVSGDAQAEAVAAGYHEESRALQAQGYVRLGLVAIRHQAEAPPYIGEVLIAHGGLSVATLCRYSDEYSHHLRTRLEDGSDVETELWPSRTQVWTMGPAVFMSDRPARSFIRFARTLLGLPAAHEAWVREMSERRRSAPMPTSSMAAYLQIRYDDMQVIRARLGAKQLMLWLVLLSVMSIELLGLMPGPIDRLRFHLWGSLFLVGIPAVSWMAEAVLRLLVPVSLRNRLSGLSGLRLGR